MPLILGTNSIKDTGFDVANSLRFNSGSDDSLSINAGTSSNRRTFTFSTWVKTSAVESDRQELLGAGGSSDQNHILIEQQGGLSIWHYTGSFTTKITTSALLRDPSAWMHLVCAVDTTQGTESNRIKLYINGVQQTSLSETNYPDQNFDFDFMQNGTTTYIGRRGHEAGYRLNSYLAETVFIDGQQLDPTSFGEFDSDSPTIWKPIDVSGLTFGNAGFYLDYEDSSALGNDVSGNDNDFTVNNLTAIDQSTDTCTNNFATGNPLLKNPSNTLTFSEGNLKIVTDASSRQNGFSTIGVTTGKWYGEFKLSSDANNKAMIGIANGSGASETSRNNSYLGTETGTVSVYNSGTKYIDGSSSSYGNSYSAGDIIGIALDLDNSAVYFSIDGTFQNSGNPTSGASKTGAISFTKGDDFWFMGFGDGSTSGAAVTWEANFGSPPYAISSCNADGNGYGNFEYSVPSGYYALNTKNLAEFG